MTRASSHRLIGGALRAALSTLSLLAFITASRAQEPPLDVGGDGRLAASPGTAYALDQWLFYPGLTASTTYSDNLFNSSIAPISALGFELSPSLTAEWTNGIHTTTLNANFDHTTYPTDTDLNTFNWGGSFTQKYAPLRDLTFSLNGNYAHQTLSNGLQNSIPTPVNAPQTTILPDGNTLLPNGVILSPLGVPIGQTTPTLAISNGTTLINPNDQFTGTLSIDKIFNHGILSLNGSLAQTDYETNGSQDSTSKSFVEHAGAWLGPLFYAYSDGSIATTSISTTGPSTSYRLIGGIGIRQIGLIRGSVYFGHQGSWGSETSGGDVYGGRLTYYPTPVWTLNASIDETINVSSQTGPSQLALNLPVPLPVQIPLGASVQITSASLSSSYTLSPQWSTSQNIAFSHINNIGSSPTDTWSGSTSLSYSMWRNLGLSWQYQYTRVLSTTPSKQNLVTMSANYTF